MSNERDLDPLAELEHSLLQKEEIIMRLERQLEAERIGRRALTGHSGQLQKYGSARSEELIHDLEAKLAKAEKRLLNIDEERDGDLSELAVAAGEAIRQRAMAAGLALAGCKAQPLLQAVFGTWLRMCERGLMCRELDAHIDEAKDHSARLEKSWRARVQELEDSHIRLQDAHDFHVKRLENDWNAHLAETEDTHAKAVLLLQAKLKEDHELHEIQISHLEKESAAILQEAENRHQQLQTDHGAHVQDLENRHHQLQTDHGAHVRDLKERANTASEELELRLRQMEEEHAGVVKRTGNSALLALAGGKASATMAVFFHGWARASHSAHLERLEVEHSSRLQEAEEHHSRLLTDHGTQIQRMEEEWGLKVHEANEDRDASLRVIEEERIAAIKQCASGALLALMGGQGTALMTVHFHGWARACERARMEEAYGNELREAEKQHRALEEQWNTKLSEADTERARAERAWDAKLQEAEEERERVMREMAEEERAVSAEKINKAAFAFLGSLSKASLAAIFAGWTRVARRLVHERDLESRFEAVENHKADLTKEHDMQMQSMAEERKGLEQEHDRQLKQLAEDEGQKLQTLELESQNLQDTLDKQIRQHENEKLQLSQERDDDREKLMKESKALVLLMGDSMASKNQCRAVTMQFFLAWSQLCKHLKWNRFNLQLQQYEEDRIEYEKERDDERDTLLRQHEDHRNRVAKERDDERETLLRQHEDIKDTLLRQHEDDRNRVAKEQDDERENLLKQSKVLALMQRSAMGDAAHTMASKHQKLLVMTEFVVAWSQLCKHNRIAKEHDDDREKLLKEAKALALMHRSAIGGAANTMVSKHQAMLVLMEFFVAWSQFCKHLKFDESCQRNLRILGRWEGAAEQLALLYSLRNNMTATFLAWLQLLASICKRGTAEIQRPLATPGATRSAPAQSAFEAGPRQVQIRVRASSPNSIRRQVHEVRQTQSSSTASTPHVETLRDNLRRVIQ